MKCQKGIDGYHALDKIFIVFVKTVLYDGPTPDKSDSKPFPEENSRPTEHRTPGLT